ncbi:MAG: IclR family transcriptional regulator [Terriglobia bacterium]
MARQSNEAAPIYRAQVLERVFALLDILARNNKDQSLGELTETLGLHKSTTHRLLKILERHRFVERDAASGKYLLGSRLLELGMRVAARLDIPELARPHLERLSRESGETAHVGILRDGEVFSIANVEGHHTLRTPATVGRKTPAHCSSLGKALLAFLPAEEVDAMISRHGLKAYTRNTLTRPRALKTELQMVRERGYAVDEEEFEEGLKCISAPVFDHTGKAIAAISIAGAAFRVKAGGVPAVGRSVMRAAADLSRSLGYAAGRPEPPNRRKRPRARRIPPELA